MMITEQNLLIQAYNAFNARDIDAALDTMHPDVDWPNGMEGGRVQGHGGIRDYWHRQWRVIDPHVEPVAFAANESGRIVADVRQVVRNAEGEVVSDTMVHHVYHIEEGLIRSMDIVRPEPEEDAGETTSGE